MPRRKEAGSLTGSKRFKEQKQQQEANSIGAKAKAIADAAGTTLTRVNDSGVVSQITSTAGQVATQAIQTSSNTINQSLVALGNVSGFTHGYASGSLQHSIDAYGGLTLPQHDFALMIPGDLLNPQIQLQATEEQLTNGLAQYAAGKRAQELLQAGFSYIEEVGKTKQSFHKAQQSIVRAATEEVKVKQNIVEFDIANVELAIRGEKLNQSNERLKQEQIKTTAAQNETIQLVAKIEATEGKRQAEIQRINAQTNDIIAKYLKDSIKGAA